MFCKKKMNEHFCTCVRTLLEVSFKFKFLKSHALCAAIQMEMD